MGSKTVEWQLFLVIYEKEELIKQGVSIWYGHSIDKKGEIVGERKCKWR